MAITINTNTIASQASLNVSRASNLLQKSLSRLSSGQRIVSPSDDAGGLAVGMKLESAMRRTEATKFNIQNGISYLQVQDGAMKVTGSILDRMAELKSYYNDISKNDLDRENYNYEFNELQKQLNELQAAKFNGVSLFATVEPDNNPMKVITTEDGVSGKVEMNRTGLFENLKSKYGADSVLNTGSNGEARQLVGNFTKDGMNDSDGNSTLNDGNITKDYEVGEVVYWNGNGNAANAGYFQVLEGGANITEVTDAQGNKTKKLIFNPASTIAIQDTGAADSNFIKIGNPLPNDAVNHDPFAEAYSSAEKYSSIKMQYVGNNTVGYLAGDMVKVSINNDPEGPGYRYFKADATAATVIANGGGTTPGAFNAAEWIEVGQLTNAGGGFAGAGSRIHEPTRKNGSHADGDGIDYSRGDKLYFQGDYYQYISLSNSSSFDTYNGAASDGYTYMEDLIDAGAVVKLSAYVDTVARGGSPDSDSNAFYDANTELQYIDRLANSGMVRTNTIVRAKNPGSPSGDDIFRSADDLFYKGLHSGNDGIYGTSDDYYQTTSSEETAKKGYHIDADADNNKDLLDESYDLSDFSVADFVDYIQTLANARAVNGGTMSRLNYAQEMLEENYMNLEAATGRIMDADMALESTKFARQNVLVQAGASMVVQANQLSNIVLALLA